MCQIKDGAQTMILEIAQRISMGWRNEPVLHDQATGQEGEITSAHLQSRNLASTEFNVLLNVMCQISFHRGTINHGLCPLTQYFLPHNFKMQSFCLPIIFFPVDMNK